MIMAENRPGKNVKAAKLILGTASVFLVAVLLLAGSFEYMTRRRVRDVDISVSPGGEYVLVLQSVGDPDWPFGHTHAKVVLRQGKRKISEIRFDIANDGAVLSPGNWSVSWEECAAVITVSGDEQEDGVYTMYFDGGTEIPPSDR